MLGPAAAAMLFVSFLLNFTQMCVLRSQENTLALGWIVGSARLTSLSRGRVLTTMGRLAGAVVVPGVAMASVLVTTAPEVFDAM
jgi:hypothetical protein